MPTDTTIVRPSPPHRAVRPHHGGAGAVPRHDRPSPVHRRRLLPLRGHRRGDRAFAAEYVRRPKVDTESATLGLDRMELGAFIAQGTAGSVVDQALACLLGLLGLRISEALNIDIEHLGIQRGHRTVTVLGKGSKLAVIPLPPRVAGLLTWPPESG